MTCRHLSSVDLCNLFALGNCCRRFLKDQVKGNSSLMREKVKTFRSNYTSLASAAVVLRGTGRSAAARSKGRSDDGQEVNSPVPQGMEEWEEFAAALLKLLQELQPPADSASSLS